MLKKLASPKKKGLAPAAFGAIGEEQGFPDQAATSPSTQSDKGKAKTKMKAKEKEKEEEKEEKAEQTAESQQASLSISESVADAKNDGLESTEVQRPKDAGEHPALERRPRRRSVLEDKPAPSTQQGSAKDTGKRKAVAKKSKKEAAQEIKAIQEEGSEADATEAQENQAAEQKAASSGATSDSKRERGFFKSLTQATRGHRASSSNAPQQEAVSPPKEQTKKQEIASSKRMKTKKQTTKEGEDDKQEEHTPSSSPSKQQKQKQKKQEKSRKTGSKQRDGADTDNNNDDTAGEERRSGKRSKETAIPVGGNLSPIRRRPPSCSGATDSAMGRTGALMNQFAPLSQPEVHLIGEIVGGGGFSDSGDGLICKWHVEFGSYWHHVAGHYLGQTQIAYPSPTTAFNQREDDKLVAVWAHPIDVHLATSVFHGWPKLVLQVWRVDKHMSTRVAGYGFAAVPFAAGEHELRVRLWRPVSGSWVSELGSRLMGNTPELVTDDVVFRSAIADRCRLETVATGTVCVRIGVMLRNFDGLKEGYGG